MQGEPLRTALDDDRTGRLRLLLLVALTTEPANLNFDARPQRLVALQFLQRGAHIGEAVSQEQRRRGEQENEQRFHGVEPGRFSARPGFFATMSSMTSAGATSRSASRSTISAVEIGNR